MTTAGQPPTADTPSTVTGGDQQPPTASSEHLEEAGTEGTTTPSTAPAHWTAQDDAQGMPTPPRGKTDLAEQNHGPIWSASEAARRCGIGRATMTRRLQAGAIPGATRDEDGHWQVPLSGLLAAGFHPDRPAPPEDAHQENEPALEDAIAAAVELAELRGQLAVERARREAAEQLAAERAARVEDLRRALRALEPPAPAQEANPQPIPPAQPAQELTPEPPQPPPEGVAGRLRRWWKGRD